MILISGSPIPMTLLLLSPLRNDAEAVVVEGAVEEVDEAVSNRTPSRCFRQKAEADGFKRQRWQLGWQVWWRRKSADPKATNWQYRRVYEVRFRRSPFLRSGRPILCWRSDSPVSLRQNVSSRSHPVPTSPDVTCLPPVYLVTRSRGTQTLRVRAVRAL
jgi:hypothetical protein